MAAAKYNLKIEQGATFSSPITWAAGDPAVPVNLTGCTARLQIRKKIEDIVVLLELTTENGGITLGGVTGVITLRVSAVATAAIQWVTGVYDLEIVFAGGVVRRLLSGAVSVSKEVTR